MTYSQHRANLKEVCKNQILSNIDSVEHRESVNKKLEKHYSGGDETLLFRTFEEWEKMGYRVTKGEKAFLFWGVPEDFEIRNPNDPAKIESVGTYFPIIFKFSEKQVYNHQNLR
ncbi:MAG TPA: hypothetical protein VK152_00350 [Paludibacter sp.]|nr:hypothetical protein [Paludibacter sp.]